MHSKQCVSCTSSLALTLLLLPSGSQAAGSLPPRSFVVTGTKTLPQVGEHTNRPPSGEEGRTDLWKAYCEPSIALD